MQKIRILHIIKSLGRGGAETLLPETLQLHDRDKFEFHYIYFLPWKDQLVAALRQHGGLVTCLEARNNLAIMTRVPQVARYIREHKVSLVHAHLPWAGIASRLVARLYDVPVLYTEHNKQERYHRVTRLMNLATMNWLRGIIAVSTDVADSIRKHKPRLTSALYTVPNGVNVSTFRRAEDGSVREKLGIPPSAAVVGTIAVFRFQKRLHLWLENARDILSQRPDTHFVIVGDGPLKEELLTKYRALGLEGRVHFAGLQTDVKPYLAAMDIFMMSSVFEGLPIALLEAMSFGLPVVTTDAGGIKEVVRDGKEGLVCSTAEPSKLTPLALTLLNDQKLRMSLGINARTRIEEAFSMQRMVRDLEDIYLKHLKP